MLDASLARRSRTGPNYQPPVVQSRFRRFTRPRGSAGRGTVLKMKSQVAKQIASLQSAAWQMTPAGADWLTTAQLQHAGMAQALVDQWMRDR